MLRVPNRIAKTASSTAHHIALSMPPVVTAPCATPPSTPNDIATALNCSAMYGTTAITAITATSAARPCDLPKRAPMKSAIEVMLRCLTTCTSRRSRPKPNTNSRIGPR